MPVEYVPIRLQLGAQGLSADWIDLAGTARDLPFLHDRILAALALGREPQRSPLPAAQRGRSAPAGFILHSGRCGSSLISRCLAQLPDCHVIAEPQAINDVLFSAPGMALLPVAQRQQVLSDVIAAFMADDAPETRAIFKLSSWNGLHLPLLDALYPDLPRLFIYRDPVEILVSLRDRPAPWQRRADDAPLAALFLRQPPQATVLPPLDFAARVVGATMAAVADSLEKLKPGRWLLIPYRDLPEAITNHVLPHFGLPPDPSMVAWLKEMAGRDAKDASGQRVFQDDTAAKRAAADPALLVLAQRWLQQPYQRLENLRQKITAATA